METTTSTIMANEKPFNLSLPGLGLGHDRLNHLADPDPPRGSRAMARLRAPLGSKKRGRPIDEGRTTPRGRSSTNGWRLEDGARVRKDHALPRRLRRTARKPTTNAITTTTPMTLQPVPDTPSGPTDVHVARAVIGWVTVIVTVG